MPGFSLVKGIAKVVFHDFDKQVFIRYQGFNVYLDRFMAAILNSR